MKKVTLLCALVLASFGAKAQGFYADFNVGYGLGLPGNVLGVKTHEDNINGVITKTSSNIKGSVGQGLTLQLTPGYMFTEHIGVELGINYFLGARVTAVENTSSITLDNQGIDNEDFTYDQTSVQSNQLRLIPSVIISTGVSNKVSGYVKAGIIMPVLGLTRAYVEGEIATLNGSDISRDKTYSELEVRGSFSLGFRGAVGLNYNITDKLSVFGEIYVTTLNIRQKNRTLVSQKYNDVEVSGNIPVYNIEIEYVKELNENSNNSAYNSNYKTDLPKQELFAKTNFDQFGLQVGVKYNF